MTKNVISHDITMESVGSTWAWHYTIICLSGLPQCMLDLSKSQITSMVMAWVQLTRCAK